MKSLVCLGASQAVRLGGGASVPGPLATHVAWCPSCRIEAGRYQRLQRELRSLSGEIEEAPAMLHAMVMHGIEGATARTIDVANAGRLAHRRATVAAGAGATLVVAAAVAIFVRRRVAAAAG